MDFRTTSLPDLVADVTSRRVSARELVEHTLARIDASNPSVNAFVAVDAEASAAAADDVDRRVAAGDDVGPLAGIPIGVKDLEDAIGFVTTQRLGDARATTRRATRDSVLVARLRARGRDRRRQDQHARVRPQTADRQPHLRHHPQPLGPRTHAGRLVGRNVGGAGVGHGAARDRRPTAAGRSASRRRRPRCRG